MRSWKFYLMLAVKWSWAYYTNVSLYSRLALGVSYQHLSFSGLEYRRSAIGSFIELGVGNEGILSAGISLRF